MFNANARRIRDRLMRKRISWRSMFLDGDGKLTPPARVVIADLTKFCRGLTSTMIVSPITRTVDPIASANAEGRREVLLHILKELNVDLTDVVAVMKEEEVLAA